MSCIIGSWIEGDFRELLPGTWTVEDGKIVVTNFDGSVDVLETNWAQVRSELAKQEQYARAQRAESLKEHLLEKRNKKQRTYNGRGK